MLDIVRPQNLLIGHSDVLFLSCQLLLRDGQYQLVKGVDRVDFPPLHSQPCPMHLHHVQPGADPQLPCLCGKGGSLQVNLQIDFFRIYILSSPSFNQRDFFASPGPSGIEFKGAVWQPTRAFYNLTNWSMFIYL